MVSIAIRVPAHGPAKRVSGWSQHENRLARTLAMFMLDGVGLIERQHFERSRFIQAFRRQATPAEIAALPDIGIATEAKGKLHAAT